MPAHLECPNLRREEPLRLGLQASYRSTLNLKPAAFPTRGGNEEAAGRGVCTWVAYRGDVTIALRRIS